jgi:hypothetical protein
MATLLIGIPLYFYTNDLWFPVLFFAGSFLIDIDHYLLSIWMTKSLDIRKSYRHWMRTIYSLHHGRGHPYVNFIFHSVEAFAIVLIASLYRPEYYFLLFGMIVHLGMDIIYMYTNYGVLFGLKRWSLFQSVWDKRRVFRSPRNSKPKKSSYSSKRL